MSARVFQLCIGYLDNSGRSKEGVITRIVSFHPELMHKAVLNIPDP
jgi:hypothetical protein